MAGAEGTQNPGQSKWSSSRTQILHRLHWGPAPTLRVRRACNHHILSINSSLKMRTHVFVIGERLTQQDGEKRPPDRVQVSQAIMCAATPEVSYGQQGTTCQSLRKPLRIFTGLSHALELNFNVQAWLLNIILRCQPPMKLRYLNPRKKTQEKDTVQGPKSTCWEVGRSGLQDNTPENANFRVPRKIISNYSKDRCTVLEAEDEGA